jgi:hypothetical protein
MSEHFEVPCSEMWELAEERPVLTGYSQAAGADGPLTGCERRAFAREIGERRKA